MAEFFSKSALTDDHYKAIGLIAAEWSVLELAVETAIIQFLADEWDIGRIITIEMGNVSRQNALLALAKWHMENIKDAKEINYITPEQYKTLVKLCAQIDNLRVRRNEAVHAYWLPPQFRGTGTTQHMKVSAKRALKVELRPLILGDLQKLAEDILATHLEFREFFSMELGAWFFV